MQQFHFGTDGIRGPAQNLVDGGLGARMASFFAKKYPGSRVLIGRDSRPSGQTLIHQFITQARHDKCLQVIYLDICSSPMLSYLLKREFADFGLMFSASHNPASDNGVKVFVKGGLKAHGPFVAEIEEFLNDTHNTHVPMVPQSEVLVAQSLRAEYFVFIQALLPYFEEEAGPKISFDLSNGSYYGPDIQLVFGQNIDIVKIDNGDLQGSLINDGYPEKSVAEILNADPMADYSFILDGDADRLTVVSKKHGLLSGEQLMLLFAAHLKKHDRLKHNKIATTIMSNEALIQALDHLGIAVDLVSVGDINVMQELLAHDLNFGGEESGHFIFRDFLNSSDALLSAALFLRIVGMEPEMADQIFTDYTAFPQKLINIANFDFEKNYQQLRTLIDDLNHQHLGQATVSMRQSGTQNILRLLVKSRDQIVYNEVLMELENILKGTK